MNARVGDVSLIPPPPGVAAAPASDLKALVAKVTGVLLVVPALINAGYEVYAAALKLPRTDAEKVNTAMFKKYFNKAPLATLPVPVKSSVGTVDARFAIYEEGEIYVEFGKLSQWFPFPRVDQPKTAGFSLFSRAFAQSAPPADLLGRNVIATQHESIYGSTLVRSRTYVDGTTEQRQIDLRSGSTLSVNFGKVNKESVSVQAPSPELMRIEPIDLNHLRMQQRLK